MSSIRILPENLANQIAAGEVVERPASVVKELVENALDAGATSLTVAVEGGGTSLIRVLDNGCGMDRDDILLSLERHATSKITCADDLEAITTLGFRGEAVPSIASVARLTITSRPFGAELGSRVEVKFGKVAKVHEMGGPVGTAVEVRDLFGNVPARKKFLKSARTELAHIEEVIRNYGLVRPDLALSYLVNDREVLGLSPAGDKPGSRLRSLLGGAVGELVAIPSSDSATEAVTVSGFLVAPDQAPAGGRLHLFVNGRPVRDRLLLHAVAEGLRNFLLKGHVPAGVVLLAVSPGEVDVNVHPTKQEVRFRQPSQIHQTIVAAVSGAMVAHQEGLRRKLFGQTGAAETPGVQVRTVASTPDHRAATAAESPRSLQSSSRPAAPTYQQPRLPEVRAAEPEPASRQVTPPAAKAERPPARQAVSEPAPAKPPLPVGDNLPGHLRVIGQLFDSYLLCEGEGMLVAIDQHAAQERLLFERLHRQVSAGGALRQGLLFPVTVELSASELSTLEEAAAEIAALGLEVREFGGATCLIQAVPALLAHLDPAVILRGVLAGFGERSGGKRLDEVLAVMACKAAVKANHPLQPEEMAALLKEMQANGVFSHCPHGRPTVRTFSAAEVKKWFHRT